MELRHVRVTDPLVRPLLAGLGHEYHQRYGLNDELSSTEESDFDPPAGDFVVYVAGEITAAGGGFRAHAPGVCEVKRMWTSPDYRRRGLATLVLDALEQAAVAAGYRRLVLETGPRQPEAAAMYERRGYTRIPRFGRYAQALAFAIELDQPARST
jgi:GNAT superfamily N-acetyltransferase